MRRPSWLRWPVSAEWADTLTEQNERLRDERDDAYKARDTAVFNRQQVLGQYAELDEKYTGVCIVNRCLTEDLAAAREELAELRAQSSDSAAAHWSAQARREKKRADRLQKQYDDAVGLKPGGIEDSRKWQPGYKEGAS